VLALVQCQAYTTFCHCEVTPSQDGVWAASNGQPQEKDPATGSFLLYYKYAPVAQLDRALVSGTKGRGFESLRAHQFFTPINFVIRN
jgi:hypothetical protein